MDLKSLEQFCQTKGTGIVRILLEEYDSAEFELNGREIEREIYEVAASYSRILFFEAKQFLQESVRAEIKTHLSSRFDSKQVQRMNDIDLIAHWIKAESIKLLEDKNIFIL